MKEYLVMECHPGYAVVLDREGRFLRVANLGYTVGQLVDEVVEALPPVQETETSVPSKRKVPPLVRWGLGAVAACLCLLLVGLGRFSQSLWGTVVLDMGPAAEIRVNHREQVMEILPLNDAGSALLEEYSARGKALDTVCEELAALAARNGYWQEGDAASLTVESEDTQWKQRTETRLWEQLAAYTDTTLLVLPVMPRSTPAPESLLPFSIPEESPASGGKVPYPAGEDEDDDDDDDEHEHHHEHGEHCCHHDHDEHDHDHDDDDDHDEHDEHHHEHGEHCCCGHHHHHHDHDADEIFTSWGKETVRKFSRAEIEEILKTLSEDSSYGVILRAKGMLPSQDGTWIYFDMVPEEYEIREGQPEYTGRLCVIGSKIDETKLEKLFML